MDLDNRARLIFSEIVDSFLMSGEPLGSRSLSKRLQEKVSAATIRNVMADLQEQGLIYAPHTSAGRLPTDTGLRFYVDTLMQHSQLSEGEKQQLEQECLNAGMPVQDIYERTSRTLSGLSSCAGLVLVPKQEAPLRHIEFLHIERGKALAVLVLDNGQVENRLIDVPHDIAPGDLQQASNYLKDRLFGKTLSDMQNTVQEWKVSAQKELDTLTARVVEAGLAVQPSGQSDLLVIQGTGKMLQDGMQQNIESIQLLFDLLEKQETATRLLEQTASGDGVQIFIGAENRIFQNDGLSMVISTYRDEQKRIVGATGVIGPTRLNYRKVVPMVDYTAHLMSKLISGQS